MSEWSPKVRRVSGEEDRAKLAFVNSLLSERRFAEADAEATKILSANERSFGAHMAKGRALQGEKKFEDSLTHFKRAAELDPMQASAHLMAGMSAFMCSNYEFAEERFQVAINIDPKAAPAYMGLAQLQYRRSEIEKARENIEKALSYSPDMAPAQLLRARILAKSGDSKGAIDQLKHVVKAHPDNRQALLSLAAVHMQNENFAEAERLLVLALEERAEDPIVNGLLGRARLRLGDFTGAEKAIRASMKNQPKLQNLGRSVQLAEALLGQKRFSEARQLLEDSPRFGPMAAIVNAKLGDLNAAEGQYQQAVAHYRAALLQSKDGEASVRELDARTEQTDPAERARLYRAATEERQQIARKSLAEQDWQSMLDKYRPVIAQYLESWRSASPPQSE